MAARMGELVEHLRHVEVQRDALREMLRRERAGAADDDISDLF